MFSSGSFCTDCRGAKPFSTGYTPCPEFDYKLSNLKMKFKLSFLTLPTGFRMFRNIQKDIETFRKLVAWVDGLCQMIGVSSTKRLWFQGMPCVTRLLNVRRCSLTWWYWFCLCGWLCHFIIIEWNHQSEGSKGWGKKREGAQWLVTDWPITQSVNQINQIWLAIALWGWCSGAVGGTVVSQQGGPGF